MVRRRLALRACPLTHRHASSHPDCVVYRDLAGCKGLARKLGQRVGSFGPSSHAKGNQPLVESCDGNVAGEHGEATTTPPSIMMAGRAAAEPPAQCAAMRRSSDLPSPFRPLPSLTAASTSSSSRMPAEVATRLKHTRHVTGKS